MIDATLAYRAIDSRDERFDGLFFLGVTTTGIYCRPSCPARAPRRDHVRLFPTAAAAQHAGFRACKRCHPGAAPGSPEWNQRRDVAGRSLALIADGLVDREGVAGLARRVGYSERQLRRHLVAELGASPIALARAQRTETARQLLESTDMTSSEIAFAAGFASIRQFHETLRALTGSSPAEIRDRARRRRTHGGPGTISLRLAYRAPLALSGLLEFLASRAVPGLEEGDATSYRRVLRLAHGSAIASIAAGPGATVALDVALADLRDLSSAVARVRRLLDLDADPKAVDHALGEDALLAPRVRAVPGLRVPGHPDGGELAVRAVLGQQVSVAAARTFARRLVERHGARLETASGSLTHAFVDPATLDELDLSGLGLTGRRIATLQYLSRALREGSLDLGPGADRDETRAALVRLPGIGPWTASYVALRALGDPDAFLEDDLGIRHALSRAGEPDDAASIRRRAEAWRPWRAYAALHLWTTTIDKEEP